MFTTTTLCRRRWARRGRGLADFAFGFALAGLSHVFVALYRASQWTYTRLRAAFQRKTRRTSRPPRSGRGSLQQEVNRLVASSGPADGAAIGNQAAPGTGFHPLAEKPHVLFSDVAGLDEAKRDILLRMVLPLQHPEKAQALGIRRGGGLLLYGSPGTGKTLLAKATATELDCPFYHVRPSDIISSQVGDAEKNVRDLFRTARAHERAVLFLDEVEALVPSRRRNGSTIMARVISQFLSEVDGLSSGSDRGALLLIGASNAPDLIDPAMCRPGRFDTTVYVGPPDAAAREQILRQLLAGRPVADDVNIPSLVEITGGRTGAEIRGFVQQASDRAFLRSIRQGEGGKPEIVMADFGPDQGFCATDGAANEEQEPTAEKAGPESRLYPAMGPHGLNGGSCSRSVKGTCAGPFLA